jgi:FkbM family methyltransferase
MYKTKIRDTEIDGVSNWVWPIEDEGAWEGPSQSWIAGIPDFLKKYCKQFKTAIQAGGNCGLYPKLLSQMFEKVYTFEPDSYNFHCLVNNCQSDNIIKINAALGSSHKMIDLNRPDKRNTGCHTIKLDSQTNIIPMLMLDDFMFEHLDLIYLDVEGWELDILSGATNTLFNHKPVIVCENGSTCIENLLKPFNYKREIQHHSDTVFVYEDL